MKVKILVECHHLLGDVVIMMPFLQALHNWRPDAEIHMIVGGKNEEILADKLGIVSRFFYMNTGRMRKKEYISLLFNLRKEHYDYGFACMNTSVRNGILFMKLAGCKKTVGPVHEGLLHHSFEVAAFSQIHEVYRNLKLLSPFLTEPKFSCPLMTLSDREKEEAFSMIHKNTSQTVITICMGTGDFIYKTQKNRISYNCKAWGYQNFISLIGKLEREGIKVVLIGGKKEQEEMEKEGIKVTDTNLVCNLIGKTSMVQSLSILGLSNLVIGCDTGMMHCAAALNIPTLSIFGATNPEVAKPFSERAYIITGSAECAPCIKTYSPGNSSVPALCKERRCISSISVEDVYRKAIAILEREAESECRN